MTVATSDPIILASLVALRAALTPTLVGDAVKPAGAGWQGTPGTSVFKSYVILYGGGVAGLGGSIANPQEDATHVIQTTSVGLDAAGARKIRDRARLVLLDRSMAITGHAVVWADLATARPPERDDAVSPPLLYAVDVLHLHVTPV